jgi:hypothetical protein
MVVTCESDDCVFEAGRRSKARDAQTSDDESLRYALQGLSMRLGKRAACHAHEDER